MSIALEQAAQSPILMTVVVCREGQPCPMLQAPVAPPARPVLLAKPAEAAWPDEEPTWEDAEWR